ncbi:hypothetical protein [Lentzea sp. NPDC004782]|uniref:hypothetical protein n=1 Tax=Lentzea sp. NPDC004782 TaxID=3154458 RepID=UPI0033AB1FB1
MKLDPSWVDLVRAASPFAAALLTALVATLAIVYNRKSTRDTLEVQLLQRMWEKRADVYIEMIDMVKKLNPYRGKTLEWMRDASAKGEPVSFLAKDMDSPKWRKLETRINALVSEEVLSLFELWRSAIGQYTWAAAAALLHFEKTSKHHDEMMQKYEASMKAVHRAEELLVAQVRIELRFDYEDVPDIRVKTGISGVSEIVSVNGNPIDSKRL